VRIELKAVELARYSSPYKPMKPSANKVARAGNFIFVSTCAKYLENGSPPSRAKAQAIRPEAINWGGIAAITKRSAENDLCGDTCKRGMRGRTSHYHDEQATQEHRQCAIASCLIDKLHGRKPGIHDLGIVGGGKHGGNHNRQAGQEADEHCKITIQLRQLNFRTRGNGMLT